MPRRRSRTGGRARSRTAIPVVAVLGGVRALDGALVNLGRGSVADADQQDAERGRGAGAVQNAPSRWSRRCPSATGFLQFVIRGGSRCARGARSLRGCWGSGLRRALRCRARAAPPPCGGADRAAAPYARYGGGNADSSPISRIRATTGNAEPRVIAARVA